MPVDILYARALGALERDRERRIKKNRARVSAGESVFRGLECVSALRVSGGVLLLGRFERLVERIS